MQTKAASLIGILFLGYDIYDLFVRAFSNRSGFEMKIKNKLRIS